MIQYLLMDYYNFIKDNQYKYDKLCNSYKVVDGIWPSNYMNRSFVEFWQKGVKYQQKRITTIYLSLCNRR